MSKPVTLPSRTFPTRTAALEFCRRLHNEKYTVGAVITDPDDDAVLRDLVALHPRADEKVGPGVAEFYIDYVSSGDRPHVRHGLTGIWIRDTDGRSRDFSYNTAIKQPSDQAVVKEALRNEVMGLREKLRESAFAAGPVTCPRSGVVMTRWDEAAIVYEDPDWGSLTSGFAASIGGWGVLETDSGDGAVRIGRRLRDRALAARWLAYWSSEARPVTVSKDALRD